MTEKIPVAAADVYVNFIIYQVVGGLIGKEKKMQSALKVRFTLAKLPSKNFIYFKPGKDVNRGVYGEHPIHSYVIKVENGRPNVDSLRSPPFVARPLRRLPMLTIEKPSLVFERVVL